MKTWIVVLAMWGVASGLQAGTGRDLANRLESANPVNGWIPAGTVIVHRNEFGTNGFDQRYQYAIETAATYRADGYALIENRVVAGEIPMPPRPAGYPAADPNAKPRMSGDSTIWISPQEYTALPFGATVAYRTARAGYPAGAVPASDGTLTTAILDDLRACKTPVSSDRATVVFEGGGRADLAVDEAGRLTRLVISGPDYERLYEYSHPIRVNDRWVPERIVRTVRKAGRTRVTEMEMHYEPGEPSQSELRPPEGLKTMSPGGRSAPEFRDLDTGSAPETQKRSNFWVCLHLDFPYKTYFTSCCAVGVEECYSTQMAQYCEHGHCYHTLWPDSCSSESQPVILYWACEWHPEWGNSMACTHPCWQQGQLDACWEDNVCQYNPW